MRILLADNDKATLGLLEKQLIDRSHTVYPAASETSAWTQLRSDPVDIVICDLRIGGINGLELCEKIRKTQFENYIYFILISSQKPLNDAGAALETGIDDYIVKPVDRDLLIRKIEEKLGGVEN
ncbi:hypothetical protein DRQ26_03735 [bacterium]|nr:MAG: hypothetical protein DRQ26_03735 [bacterium]